MSVGPRAPAVSESSVCGIRTPCGVVRNSLSWAGHLARPAGSGSDRSSARLAPLSASMPSASASAALPWPCTNPLFVAPGGAGHYPPLLAANHRRPRASTVKAPGHREPEPHVLAVAAHPRNAPGRRQCVHDPETATATIEGTRTALCGERWIGILYDDQNAVPQVVELHDEESADVEHRVGDDLAREQLRVWNDAVVAPVAKALHDEAACDSRRVIVGLESDAFSHACPLPNRPAGSPREVVVMLRQVLVGTAQPDDGPQDNDASAVSSSERNGSSRGQSRAASKLVRRSRRHMRRSCPMLHIPTRILVCLSAHGGHPCGHG